MSFPRNDRQPAGGLKASAKGIIVMSVTFVDAGGRTPSGSLPFGRSKLCCLNRFRGEVNVSSRTILILLGVIVAITIVAFVASPGSKPEGEPVEKPAAAPRGRSPLRGWMQQIERSEAEQAERRRTAPKPAPPKPAPTAAITVDGKADDWAGVPAVLTPPVPRPGDKTYSCKAVKIARDDENLFVLFILGLGVGERFDNQLASPRGRPSTGALGYFNFQTEGRKFVIWLPTGFCQTYEKTGKFTSQVPTADFEVGRYNPKTDSHDTVLEAASNEQPEFIAFDGKHLELKVPLAKLGIAGDHPMQVELSEM